MKSVTFAAAILAMLGCVTTQRDTLLWTLEEISHLVSNSGHPEETLGNIVQLIQRTFDTDVCSVYLLEPDRATLVLAATIGLRPGSVGRVRMRLSEGLAGLVGEQLKPQVVEDATRHPRFKYFSEAGEDPYHSFLGVPLIDKGLLQGVLVVQTIEPRAFSPDAVSMLTMAGTQLASIVSQARTLGTIRRARAPPAGGARPEHVVELGSRHREHLPRARSRRCGASSITTRLRCSSRFRSRGSKSARRRSCFTAASTTRTAGCRSTSPRHTRGARGTQACSGRGRSRTFPPSSACTNRCRSTRAASASSPAITSRRRRISAFRSSASASITTRDISRSDFDLNGYQQEDYRDVDSSLLPIEQARDASGEPVTISIDTRTGTLFARVWKLAVGRNTLLLLDSDVDRQPAGRSRSHVAVVWRRRPRPHQTGAAARRGRRQGAHGTRHLAGRGAPQRRT